MKKVLAIFGMCGVFFFCQEVKELWGAPTYTGTRGLKSIISATPAPFGRFNYIFGFRAHWLTSSDPIDSLREWKEWKGDGKKGRCYIGDIPFGIGFSFTDYLSLNLNSVFYADVMRTNIHATGAGAVSYGVGDTHLGIKFTPTRLIFSPEVTKVFNFGIYPMVSFFTGAKRGDLPTDCGVDTIYGEPCRFGEGGLHRFYTAKGLTAGGKGLVGFDIPTEPKLPVHLNFGYVRYPNAHICSKISYGGGIEVVYPRFAPFVEIYGEERINSKYNDGGTYLSPGLRFETATNVWMTIAMDFRLSSERDEIDNPKKYYIQGGVGSAPAWAVNFTLSQGFDFRPPPPVGKAIIAGRVMDKVDGTPVRAIVTFGDTTVTTGADGRYQIELPPGKIVAYASALEKGKYKISDEVIKYVMGGEKEIINFSPEPTPIVEEKGSVLTGTVTDKASHNPCVATISFPEAGIPSVKSDDSGVYRAELPPGTYVVKVEEEGYIPQTHTVVCKAGATTILDVELSSVPRVATLAGKVVDYSSRKGIGGATIEFPGTAIPTIRTDYETGTYKAEIPGGTYQVKVKAPGYVPEGVVVVCKPGATNVKDFELFKKEEKVVLRGITFEFNSAVIRPSSYPVLDDAVELLKKHPEIRVEIGGHTCSIGSDSYNLELSRLRAESVRKYLIEHGISGDRLFARGYGESMPIASNATEAGRVLNRRIEFRILSE